MVYDTRRWFAAAWWADGRMRVELHDDRSTAEIAVECLKVLGVARRVWLGRCPRALTAADVEAQLRPLLGGRTAA